jgi:hypothetical protein
MVVKNNAVVIIHQTNNSIPSCQGGRQNEIICEQSQGLFLY